MILPSAVSLLTLYDARSARAIPVTVREPITPAAFGQTATASAV
jgi:hypothetical protein